MKPYYEQDGVTLYHGDCREVLPGLGVVNAVITDPPYQTLDAEVSVGTTTRLASSADANTWFSTLSADAVLSVLRTCRELLQDDAAMYIFTDVKSGLALLPQLECRNVIVWDKGKIGMGYAWRRMHEWIGYSPMPKHKLRSMAMGDIIRVPGVQEKVHPTEKPVAAITPLVRNSTDIGATILDPFAGVGSTLLAAQIEGRRAIGIEIEERYCEIAANRLRQGVLFGATA